MNSNQEEEEVCIFYFIKAQLVAQLLANTVDLIDTRKNVLLWCVIVNVKRYVGLCCGGKRAKRPKEDTQKSVQIYGIQQVLQNFPYYCQQKFV